MLWKAVRIEKAGVAERERVDSWSETMEDVCGWEESQKFVIGEENLTPTAFIQWCLYNIYFREEKISPQIGGCYNHGCMFCFVSVFFSHIQTNTVHFCFVNRPDWWDGNDCCQATDNGIDASWAVWLNRNKKNQNINPFQWIKMIISSSCITLKIQLITFKNTFMEWI